MKVAFKLEKNRRTGINEVFAFFPEEYDKYSNRYMSYSHFGQHSECDKDYFIHRRWASYPEYAELYNELTKIGYDNLEVLNKDFPQWNIA